MLAVVGGFPNGDRSAGGTLVDLLAAVVSYPILAKRKC
jgi:hypothetical protein